MVIVEALVAPAVKNAAPAKASRRSLLEFNLMASSILDPLLSYPLILTYMLPLIRHPRHAN